MGRITFVCESLERRRLLTVTAGAGLSIGENFSGDPVHTSAVVGDDIFFAVNAQSGVDGELWLRDGTTGQVQKLYNASGPISHITPAGAGGIVFFDDGYTLYTSDGTAAGSKYLENIDEVEDIVAGQNGVAYVVAGTGVWRSTGTSQGTQKIHSGTSVTDLVVMPDGVVYFFDGGLWRVNAGASSATRLNSLNSSIGKRNLAVLNGSIYFMGSGPSGSGLFVRDASAGQVQIVKSFSSVGLSTSYELTAANGVLFFRQSDVDHGTELWRSDGTDAGTVPVADLRPGTPSSSPTMLTAVDSDTLYFVADGVVNTVRTGREIWKTDGTEAGTVLVRDIAPGTASPTPAGLTNVGGRLVFSAVDDASGTELWQSDGTEQGTLRMNDVYPGAGGSSPREFHALGDDVVFEAIDPVAGLSLFRQPLDDPAQPPPTFVCDMGEGVLSPLHRACRHHRRALLLHRRRRQQHRPRVVRHRWHPGGKRGACKGPLFGHFGVRSR